MTRRVLMVLAASAVLAGCGSSHNDRSTATTPPAPGPIIGKANTSARDPLTGAQRAAARATAQRFLATYVPYLYGRGKPSRVGPVTQSVAHALRIGRARVTPAQARRHPRVTGLSVLGQSRRNALATVQIADGSPAPYRLTLTLEQRGPRWLVADLGDDK